MGIVITLPSITKVHIQGNKIAVGYDQDKVKNLQEDLTRMCDIDNSKSWNKDICACKVNNLKKVDTKRLLNFCKLLNIEII